jgi:phage terminase small subunit
MIRILIVGYVFAIRSERALCRDVRVNLAYRWFCGLSIEDKIPDHSAFSTQPPGEALSPKHEAFVQAYVSRGMNGTKAYRAVYPSIKSDDVAGAAAARLLGNVRVQARIAEIMRAGAEHAEVTVEQVVRELKLIGFSDIRKVVSWRNELVTRTEKGKDGEPVMVVMPRVTIVDADKISDEAAAAVAEVWQTVNGALRVKLHDKHAALVSLGRRLGLFVDRVQIQERKQISAEPMSAEEWKRQYVREG